MPLSLLSYTSILGITSTGFIVAVVFIDGFSKRTSPGSLWEFAPTSILPGHLGELGISFGLFMAGFSGHAVIPSLAKDMADPTRFDEMINWAFVSVPRLVFTT
jgi:solute carrier family 32 (vesicular inhibitory amino acid transporter)